MMASMRSANATHTQAISDMQSGRRNVYHVLWEKPSNVYRYVAGDSRVCLNRTNLTDPHSPIRVTGLRWMQTILCRPCHH